MLMVSVGRPKTDTKRLEIGPSAGLLRRCGVILKKRIRVMKKIQQDGVWKFITIERDGSRFVWDDRPGTYYIEWWDGPQTTP